MATPADILRNLGGSGTTAGSTPDIPAVPPTEDRSLHSFLQSVKNWITGATTGASKLVSVQDLVNAGAGVIDSGGSFIVITDGANDFTPPPAPTNLRTSGAMTNIILTWDEPNFPNFSYAEVWSAPSPNLGGANLIGDTTASVYSDATGELATRYYWVRFVKKSGVKGAFDSVNGTVGSTAADPTYLLNSLSGIITESQLSQHLLETLTMDSELTAAINDEKTLRENADSNLATSITNVSARLNNIGGVTLEQKFSAQADALTGLNGEYTVKIGTGDYIAGIGLAVEKNNGADPSSSFQIRADRFSIGRPGVASQIPFVVNTVTTTVNGVECPPGVYMSNAFIQDGAISNAKIGALAVDDAKIASLSAAKITFGEMSGDRITAGTLSADKIATGELTAGTRIDVGSKLRISADGWIESYSALGYNRAANYARMDSGNFTAFKYVPAIGTAVPYSFLSRSETGVADNGVEVAIPGYWASQPRIYLSPNNLQTFSAAHSLQNQTLQMQVTDLVETSAGSMQWKFTPIARLVLSANAEHAVINESASTSSNTWQSASYTTAANTTALTISVRLGSTRGTGAAPTYYTRRVTWSVVIVGIGTASSRTVNISAGALSTDTVTIDGLTPAAYTYHVEYTAADAGGTWQDNTDAYEYSTATLVGTTGTLTASQLKKKTDVLGTYPPGPIPYNNTVWYGEFTSTLSGMPAGWSAYGTNSYTVGFSPPAYSVNELWATPSTGSIYATSSPLTYSTTDYGGSVTLRFFTDAYVPPGGLYATCAITGVSVVVPIRRGRTNSTTPANTSTLLYADATLAGTTVLSTGSINWVAVGD